MFKENESAAALVQITFVEIGSKIYSNMRGPFNQHNLTQDNGIPSNLTFGRCENNGEKHAPFPPFELECKKYYRNSNFHLWLSCVKNQSSSIDSYLLPFGIVHSVLPLWW